MPSHHAFRETVALEHRSSMVKADVASAVERQPKKLTLCPRHMAEIESLSLTGSKV